MLETDGQFVQAVHKVFRCIHESYRLLVIKHWVNIQPASSRHFRVMIHTEQQVFLKQNVIVFQEEDAFRLFPLSTLTFFFQFGKIPNLGINTNTITFHKQQDVYTLSLVFRNEILKLLSIHQNCHL